MKFLRKSRALPVPGDFFRLQVLPEGFHFGHVIRNNASGGMDDPKAVLIYLYRRSLRENEDTAQLASHVGELLIPPILTNRLPWSRGYFETIGHVDPNELRLPSRHCFVTYGGEYVDEFGKEFQPPAPPIGEYGIDSYLSIGDKMCRALGIASGGE